jgi:hypothetical protein
MEDAKNQLLKRIVETLCDGIPLSKLGWRHLQDRNTNPYRLTTKLRNHFLQCALYMSPATYLRPNPGLAITIEHTDTNSLLPKTKNHLDNEHQLDM